MKEHFEKVANDLQSAHDMYRQQVDRVNDVSNRLSATHDRFNEVTPKYVNPAKTGAIFGSMGVGALAGGLLGRKHGIAPHMAIGSGGIGLLGGALLANGVDAYANHQVPERKELGKRLDDLTMQWFEEDHRLDGRQQDLIHAGLGNPPAMRALLDPTEEYDRHTDNALSDALRRRRTREQDVEDERLNLLRSESAKNNSNVGLNASSSRLNHSNARINNYMLLQDAMKE